MNRIGLLAAALVLCGLPAAAELENIQKQYKATEVQSLDLGTISCAAELIARKQDSTEVSISSSDKAFFHWDLDLKDGKLTIKEKSNMSSAKGSNEACLLKVTLPPAATAQLESVSGDIKAVGLARGVEAQTTSGRLELTSAGGDVQVKTVSGRAVLRGLSGSLRFQGISGGLDAQWSKVPETGEAFVGTVSGRMTLTLPPQAKVNWEFRAMAGRVRRQEFVSDPAAGFVIKANSVSGSLDLVKTPAAP